MLYPPPGTDLNKQGLGNWDRLLTKNYQQRPEISATHHVTENLSSLYQTTGMFYVNRVYRESKAISDESFLTPRSLLHLIFQTSFLPSCSAGVCRPIRLAVSGSWPGSRLSDRYARPAISATGLAHSCPVFGTYNWPSSIQLGTTWHGTAWHGKAERGVAYSAEDIGVESGAREFRRGGARRIRCLV